MPHPPENDLLARLGAATRGGPAVRFGAVFGRLCEWSNEVDRMLAFSRIEDGIVASELTEVENALLKARGRSIPKLVRRLKEIRAHKAAAEGLAQFVANERRRLQAATEIAVHVVLADVVAHAGEGRVMAAPVTRTRAPEVN